MFRYARPFSINSFLATAAAYFVTLSPATAHHAMDGDMPSTFGQGLLSGLAHPVIGLDHLAFIVAAGTVAAILSRGLWLPVVFSFASILGVVLHLQAFDLPFVELIIALSVIGIGLMLVSKRATLSRGSWALIFTIVGLFHGYAYGESIVGAETTPLSAYLLGLAVIQSLIGVGIALVASQKAWTAETLAPRLTGAAVFGIGLTAFVGQIVAA